MANNEITFRRIGGRIVPIRKKKRKEAEGVAMIATGGAISVAAGISSGKQLRKAEFAFGRAANLRGAAKLFGSKSGAKYGQTIRNAAAFKIAGRKFTKRSSAILLAGTTLGGILASVGANRVLKNKDKDKKALQVEGIGVAVGSLGLVPFGKVARISNIVRAVGRSKRPVRDIFNQWSKQGMRKTSSTINKYGKSSYKGVKPKPKDIFKASQTDMFGKPSKKKFDFSKFLKND